MSDSAQVVEAFVNRVTLLLQKGKLEFPVRWVEVSLPWALGELSVFCLKGREADVKKSSLSDITTELLPPRTTIHERGKFLRQLKNALERRGSSIQVCYDPVHLLGASGADGNSAPQP